MKVDVAIVGGGPAGLAAAKEVAKRGGSVIVLDENPRCGGKLLGQLHEDPSSHHWWKGAEVALSLEEEAIAAGAKLLPQTLVWGVEKGWSIYLSDTMNKPSSSGKIEAKVLLLATGAVEKPLPLPGWTLPGVMTVGAAQVLTNVYRVKPGNRVLVVGVDVLSLTIARALKLAGVDVVGIVLPVRSMGSEAKASPRKVFQQFRTMAHLAPSWLLRLAGTLLRTSWGVELAARFFPKQGIKIWKIPLLLKKAILEIEGKNQVSGAKIASIDAMGKVIPGTTKYIDVDAVCLSAGLTPLGELAATTGCRFVRLNGLSGTIPLHGPSMETNVNNLFVAGNITGIEGAKVAMAQGRLAGVSICRKLGIGKVTEQEWEVALKQVEEVRETIEIQFHPEIKEARRELQNCWEEYTNRMRA